MEERSEEDNDDDSTNDKDSDVHENKENDKASSSNNSQDNRSIALSTDIPPNIPIDQSPQNTGVPATPDQNTGVPTALENNSPPNLTEEHHNGNIPSPLTSDEEPEPEISDTTPHCQQKPSDISTALRLNEENVGAQVLDFEQEVDAKYGTCLRQNLRPCKRANKVPWKYQDSASVNTMLDNIQYKQMNLKDYADLYATKHCTHGVKDKYNIMTSDAIATALTQYNISKGIKNMTKKA